ncbi:MAG: DUF4153 domain-containing protein [Oscillospiraceae bacterium]
MSDNNENRSEEIRQEPNELPVPDQNGAQNVIPPASPIPPVEPIPPAAEAPLQAPTAEQHFRDPNYPYPQAAPWAGEAQPPYQQGQPPQQQGQWSTLPQGVGPGVPRQAPPRPPAHVYTGGERWLVLLAIAVAILFDRLAFRFLFDEHYGFFSSIFWLCFMVAFYVLQWKKLKHNVVLWAVTGLNALLCVWNLIFDYRSSYGTICWLVIPAVLMAHAQYTKEGYGLKQVTEMVGAWVVGWIVHPLSAINRFFGAIGSTDSEKKSGLWKRVLLGLGLSLPILLIIVPLLAQADQVFGYYIGYIFEQFSIGWFIFHLVVIFIASMLFYSFFWNNRYEPVRQNAPKAEKKPVFDPVISNVVLGAILLVYLLFCMVQFTYLSAGAGLPFGTTYADYAREGFAQLIAVSFINLTIFGIYLRFSPKNKLTTVFQCTLLVATGVMLVSSLMRLLLYIGTYLLTWKRLLSLWFILFLMAVLVLCAVRLVKEKLPLFGICAVTLLAWFVILGYTNPDALVMRYNLSRVDNVAEWVQDNRYYIKYDMSDDGRKVLWEAYNPQSESDTELLGYSEREAADGYSLSSNRAEKVISPKYGEYKSKL